MIFSIKNIYSRLIIVINCYYISSNMVSWVVLIIRNKKDKNKWKY